MHQQKGDKKLRKLFILLVLISLVGLISYEIFPALLTFVRREARTKNQESGIINNIEQIIPTELRTNNSVTNRSFINQENKVEEIEIKKEVDLDIPFTSQAPFKIWDDLHNNACEEAALIMVHYFLKGEKLNKEIAEKEIQSLVKWQIENWSSHKELTIDEVGKLAKEYYGWQKIKILDNITIENIKKEIANGNPVIVPTAGRLLGNPYYRQPGPYYHMLVVRGYSKDKIITNDPGTRRGERYSYLSEILYRAIHDWPGKDKDILTGKKRMLVIEK